MSNPIATIDSLRTEDFLERAKSDLSAEEFGAMKVYIESGGQAVSPNLAANLFNLYLNGMSLYDIWKMNKQIPFGSIVEGSVKYNWREEKEHYALELHGKIRDKVIQSQLEATSLLTDMLTVMQKKNGEKFRRYIQSGDEKDLDGAINVESLNSLLKTIDSLMKITGQDKISNKEDKKLVDLQSTPAGGGRLSQGMTVGSGSDNESDLSSEDAAAILAIYTKSKNNKKV